MRECEHTVCWWMWSVSETISCLPERVEQKKINKKAGRTWRRKTSAQWEIMRRMVVGDAEDNFQRNKKSRLDQTEMLRWAELHRGSNIKPDWLQALTAFKSCCTLKTTLLSFSLLWQAFCFLFLLWSAPFSIKIINAAICSDLLERKFFLSVSSSFHGIFCHTFYILKHRCKSPFPLLKRCKKKFKQRKI